MLKIFPSDWKTGKYWLHIFLVAAIVLGILQLLFGGEMFTWHNVFLATPILGLADVSVHTLLKME